MLTGKTRAAAAIAVLLLLAFGVAATIGNIDYVFGVKNKSEMDIRAYQFTRTNGVGASGSLTTAGLNTFTMSPCPAGITASSNNHASLYISGGAGTAESVPITGYSTSGNNCTVNVTTNFTHAGAWVVSSASAGIQEAIMDDSLSIPVHIVGGGYLPINAPIYVNIAVTIHGDGMRETVLQAQYSGGGIFDVAASYVNIYDLAVQSASQGIAGGYGIRIGHGTGNDAGYIHIERIFCEYMYDCILGENAENWWIKDSGFWNFSHVAITAADATYNDDNGPLVSGNTFVESGLASPGLACLSITSGGSINFVDNNCQGFGAGQLANGVLLQSSVSSGLFVSRNYFQCLGTAAVSIGGAYQNIVVSDNGYAQPAGVAGQFILISGSTMWVTVTGNIVVGPGGSTPHYLATVSGTSTAVYIGGNVVTNSYFGLYLTQSGTVTVGQQYFYNVTYPVYGGLAGNPNTIFGMQVPVTYGNLPAAANFSEFPCTDCKNYADNAVVTGSTCVSGGSGAKAVRTNGSWRCY